MSDYVQTNFWTPKAKLETGQDKKILYGKHFDEETAAIQVAIATKAEADGVGVEVTVGVFTPTWETGFASGSEPSGNLYYEVWSDGTSEWVTVGPDQATAITGTTNATSIVISGIPARIRPSETVRTNIFAMTEAGTTIAGFIEVSLGGRFTFFAGNTAFGILSATGFTSATTCGFPAGANFTYQRALTP